MDLMDAALKWMSGVSYGLTESKEQGLSKTVLAWVCSPFRCI